jgi:hypothetical protein
VLVPPFVPWPPDPAARSCGIRRRPDQAVEDPGDAFGVLPGSLSVALDSPAAPTCS